MANSDVDLVTKSYSLLSDMIYSYELPPGAIVSDFSLSKKIGISRTPIRQAILMLVSDGIVVQEGNGFHVVDITEDFIHELYEARKYIEMAVIPILVEKKADVSELRKLCYKEEDLLKNGRYIEALNVDIDFHRALADATKNAILSKSYKVIYTRMKLINLLSLVTLNFQTPQIYLEIIDNIEEGNVDETCHLLCLQQNAGESQKITALKKFGGKSVKNLFNFISGCFVAFGNNAPTIE